MSSENVRTYWLHALTPLHVGTGQGAGAIDLPIMRERVTDWPVVPGSAVKGVLADEHGAKKGITREQDANLRAAFGSAEAADNAGALVFTDARLVCLPVRSLYGTFAWVSCPLVLERLRRDLVHAGLHNGLPAYCAVGREQASVMVGSALHNQGKIYLEDLDFIAQTHENAQQWGQNIAAWVFANNAQWQGLFAERFAIVADDTYNFLCKTATEVNARVRISDDSKTVAKGALWYEESLPAESILGGFVWCDRVFQNDTVTPVHLLNQYCAGPYMLQLGGKATTGKGRVTCLFTRSVAVNVRDASGGSDAHT